MAAHFKVSIATNVEVKVGIEVIIRFEKVKGLMDNDKCAHSHASYSRIRIILC